MDQEIQTNLPNIYPDLLMKSEEIGFNMPSDKYIGSLLKTLVASKPRGNFLELGTGMGLSLAWMVDGMDSSSRITSVDNNEDLIQIAKEFFKGSTGLRLICKDGNEWISDYRGPKFDLIFADAWPGKYSLLDLTLGLLKVGGFYVIDDMRQQPNWPEGHEQKVAELIEILETRKDFTITKMDWSTGVIVAVKIK
ncbi:MAG: O-methyltransferase [Allomuricauda sp.]